ncbi:FadR family transcriptional regulator [Verticiella sediminum]|uniref:FadR family transcriptional regulator n=1 Tax=Verticiella sediminum TaxID=1247510 RepID=A0A556AL72_9BURK|nr:FadR/GntR family transcriptional regulator [Verticiella sediminum]TSH93623.1 FadR family transcriptional regulator [Verticiella sediminum]
MSSLTRIQVPKSCDLLAAELRKRILDGEFRDGEALPVERELVAQTGLSRSSVREALRILQTEGLVRTRPGRYGGTVANRPTAEHLADQVNVFVRGRRIGLHEIVAAREAIEPMLARYAALHRTDEDLALLRASTAAMEAAVHELPRFLEANVRWHLAVAQASHNQILQAFIQSITHLIHEATQVEEVAAAETRAMVVRAHRSVLAAIEAGDADAAQRRMQRHVMAYSQQLDPLFAQ